MIRRVGAHLSCAGGYQNGLDAAMDIGANALQIFSGSPRVWARKPIVEQELLEFMAAAKQRDVWPIFVHALYLVNLASDKKESVQKSKDVLIHELKFGKYFDCAGVIVHLGSHQGRGWESVREALAQSIKEIIHAAQSPVPFLIENSASRNGKIGGELSEIKWLLDAVQEPTLGWCYDTCHGWAAGYSVTHGGKPLWETLTDLDLWSALRCLHVNDSRDPFESGRDRHANMLQGSIPREEWTALLNEPRLASVPIITEVPGLDGNGPDAENIAAIRSLFL